MVFGITAALQFLARQKVEQAPVEAESRAITVNEITQAMEGDDGMDPVSMWTFQGAPKQMQRHAQRMEQQMVAEKVAQWNATEAVRGDMQVRKQLEDEQLNVSEVDVGEDAGGRV